jgi:hypothetical protein
VRTQEFITELFDPKTALPLKWDEQFAASHNEVHAEAMDEEGRELYISFVPVGFRTATEITFTREGSYDITGQGDAARVLATVAKAIDIYLRKYSPNMLCSVPKKVAGPVFIQQWSVDYSRAIRKYHPTSFRLA